MTGEQLRRLRERHGVTQGLISECTGIGVPNISHMERGRRKISTKTEQRIRAALGRIRSGKLHIVSRLSLRQARSVLSGSGK